MTPLFLDVRFSVILSFVLLVLLGVPVWWKTTEVYRAQLPHSQIAYWANLQDTTRLVSFQKQYYVILLHQEGDSCSSSFQSLSWSSRLSESLTQSLERKNHSSFQFTVSTQVEPGLSNQLKQWRSDTTDRVIDHQGSMRTSTAEHIDVTLFHFGVAVDDWLSQRKKRYSLSKWDIFFLRYLCTKC